MSRKIIALVLTLVFVLTALAGCVKNPPLPADTTDTADTQNNDTTPPETDTKEPDTDEPVPEVPFEQKDIGTLEAGDKVYGFTLTESVDFPVFGAVMYRFVHDKTGGEFLYIANDDTARIFDLTFFTHAEDNTGIPHVFEHATTCGSEKYPVDLFFNLSYQTYNVYMNAWTGKTYTSYPLCSLSEEQLLKYADYYADACFKPTIMTDDTVFSREAWRYRLPDADSDLTIEGTVYSEMLGVRSLSRTAYLCLLRTAFPGSYVGYDEGGDPDYIPDMTWEMLRKYHDDFYHPSNCVAYLYGDVGNYSEFFKLLDSYFSEYEMKEFDREDTGYRVLSESVEVSIAHPVEAQSPTENESEIYYAFILPGLKDNQEEHLIINSMADLFYDSTSDLQKRLDSEIPHGAFGMFHEMSGPDDALVFYGVQLNPEDKDLFISIVDEEIAKVAENGFPQEQLDGIMASLSISNLIARETTGTDFVEDIFIGFLTYYTETGNWKEFVDLVNANSNMDDWNREGKYAEMARKWLIDNKLTACVVAYPDPGQKEINDQELADKLAAVKESMSEEEINALIEATNAEDPVVDTTEYVRQLQAVTVDQLPEEIKEYDIYDETDEDGIRFISAVAGVDGVGQESIFLDASGLEQDQLPWFKLFTVLVGDLDTDEHTRDEIQDLTARYLYGFRVNVSLLSDADDNVEPYLRMSWTALDDDLEEGYDLVKEIIYHTKFDDASKLLDKVTYYVSSTKSTVNNSAYAVLAYRAFAAVKPLYAYYTSINYTDYYDFLLSVQTMLEEDPDTVIENLYAIRDYFNNRTNSASVFAGNETSIEINSKLAKDFLMDLDEREIIPVEYKFDNKLQNEALIIEASVQSNVLICPDYELLGLEREEGGLEVTTSIITDKILIPVIRDEYGAYTVGNVAMDDLGMYVVTLRDPNITETFDEFDKLYDYIMDLELDQETLNGYILSTYSEYALPAGELSGAISAAISTLSGEEPFAEEYLTELKSVTPEDVKRYAEVYKKLSENGVRCTAGPASAINAHAELYDNIMNPFNAIDLSQVEFTDFDENHEYYEAIKFVLDEGLLPPSSDTEFGVDEPATIADLYGSTYVLLGGDFNPEACKELLVDNGLASEKTKLDAKLKTKVVFDLYTVLCGETIEPTTDKAVLTRGDFAQVLYDFCALLDEEE